MNMQEVLSKSTCRAESYWSCPVMCTVSCLSISFQECIFLDNVKLKQNNTETHTYQMFLQMVEARQMEERLQFLR